MVVRKRRKMRKFRGKRSYGYGSHKKHRGGGSRGGRGNAGMHKHKWSYTVKYEPNHFGKRGFKRPIAAAKKVKAINLRHLGALAAGKKKIDLTKLGYNKVLGAGRIQTAMEVVAEAFSKKAIEKIEAAGGKAVIFEKSKKETKEKEKED
jgi:large subunit ribosomal protein L15